MERSAAVTMRVRHLTLCSYCGALLVAYPQPEGSSTYRLAEEGDLQKVAPETRARYKIASRVVRERDWTDGKELDAEIQWQFTEAGV